MRTPAAFHFLRRSKLRRLSSSAFSIPAIRPSCSPWARRRSEWLAISSSTAPMPPVVWDAAPRFVGRDPRNQPKDDLPPGVIAVHYAPHAAVFPRASVIVHQGGIGTTAEAMRAGRPMLVVHYSHDQPDHAARLSRLGVARGIPREKYSAAVAASEIQALLQDKRYADRAAEIGARVRTETGVDPACDLLSRLLQKSNSERVLCGERVTC